MLTDEGNPISADASIVRAASNGDLEAVRALLSEGVDVNQRGRGGHTALMVAAIFNNLIIARLLINAGANVQLQDNLGLTARDWADRRGSWDVAHLIPSVSPAETKLSSADASASEAEVALEAELQNPADEAQTPTQPDSLVVTENPPTPEPQMHELRNYEAAPQASGRQPKSAVQPDALRFMKFHKQIMAAQERNKAAQARHEEEQAVGIPLIENNIARRPVALSTADDDATQSSERKPIATQFPAGAAGGEKEYSAQQNAPKVTHASQFDTEPQVSKAELSPPTAPQLAKIAATIEQLKTLDKSAQSLGGEDATSEREMRSSAVLGSNQDQPDITIERGRSGVFARSPWVESKTGESFNGVVKRCPQCNTTIDNPLLIFCAYDGAKLISSADTMFNYSATNDRSRQTLWALVALVAVVGAYLGYLINNYRTRENARRAPVGTASNPTITTPGAQPIRHDSPAISGDLSGMELDVPEPQYPAKVKAEGVSGIVKVRVQVNERGKVVAARSSGGDWRLRVAAVEAAKNATFSPEKVAAQGRFLSGTITYTFVAQTEPPVANASHAPTPAQATSPAVNGSSSAVESSATQAAENSPTVGGLLIGAESILPQPVYPESARSKGVRGTITVVVRVSRAGKVISWRTLEGDSRLRAAALKAAKRATFSPDKLPGKADVVGTLTYNFK